MNNGGPNQSAPWLRGSVRQLPKSVLALGLVSLFTDASSEMIMPLLPAFLASLGASGTFMGLIEGVAETTSALLKLISGTWADRVERKKPLVLFGYGLASAARPWIALAMTPWQALLIRFVDRIGKGLRSTPRDALIAQAAGAEQRGLAFGFHRAMDHAGALIGPLIAAALIAAGLEERAVFGLAAIPAALAVLVLAFAVREPSGTLPRGAAKERELGRTVERSSEPLEVIAGRSLSVLRRYLAVVALFTLASSSDLFLLLRAEQLGVPASRAPLLWALLHAIKSIFSTPLGALSDRLPRRRVIASGWLIYAAVYAAFGLADSRWQVWALFTVYGLHAAACEGAEKAMIADLVPAAIRGRAFGWFNFTVGICALPASMGFGMIWDQFGPRAAFSAASLLAVAAAGGLALLPAPR